MTQEKFIALSKEKVAKLNKGSKEAEEAWRAGYLFSRTATHQFQ